VSYLSTLCAMGSFVVTLVFARQLNDGRRYPAERVVSLLPVAVLLLFTPTRRHSCLE
jgi:hypothetical protein